MQRKASSRREFLRQSGLSVAGAASAALAQDPDESLPQQNVLLILVPDLRPELGCFGSARVRSPHIDRLAKSGMTFLRNYCQQASSGPSRASLLTGLRPDTIRVYDDRVHFRRALPDAVTIPQHFRHHGYVTTAFGSIFGRPVLDDRESWSIAPWAPGDPAWRSPAGASLAEERWTRLQSQEWLASPELTAGVPDAGAEPKRSWRISEAPGKDLSDSRVAEAAASAITALQNERFMIAVGFSRPGLPLVAPQPFYDLYPAGGTPQAPDPPLDAPSFALHGSQEIRAFADIPDDGPIPEKKARELIRGYRACVSFVDAQIGTLIDAVESQGLAETTVIAALAVTGSHLGELGLWNKHSNYEAATRAPMVVRAPGQRNAGRKTSALVESVDLFPSLCSLCGLPKPEALDGSSWQPIFDDPKRLWKRAAYSQHPRTIPGVGPGMGYSMRTSRHRYTEWAGIDSPYKTVELYDYKEAPVEWRNIANRPEYVSLVNGLAHMHREGWQGSRPPTELPTSSRA